MPVLRSGRAGEKSCQPSGNPCQLFRKSCQPFRDFCQPSRERGRRTAHVGRPGRLSVNGMEKPPPGVDRGHGGWWRRGLRLLFRSIRLRGGCILSLDCLRAYEVAETEGLPRSGLMPVLGVRAFGRAFVVSVRGGVAGVVRAGLRAFPAQEPGVASQIGALLLLCPEKTLPLPNIFINIKV